MNRSELNEKAKKYISNEGFGTGTNITIHGLKCMMVDFYLENQGQTLPIDSVVGSLPDSDEIRQKALNNDEKDFDQWWWETVYKGK